MGHIELFWLLGYIISFPESENSDECYSFVASANPENSVSNNILTKILSFWYLF